MRMSAAYCLLLGIALAVPVSAMSMRQTTRMLSDSEGEVIQGGILGLATVTAFSRCGTVEQCKDNKCPATDCSGFKTDADPNAKNQGCAVPDFFSVCMTTNNWILGVPVPTCGTVGGACQLVEEMDEDENTVLVCKEVFGNGFVIQPTAPDTCNSVGVGDILDGHM